MSPTIIPNSLRTNISAMISQKALARTEADLNTTMRNLSTGLRINSGRDDPSGFISSELLRTEISSTSQAIKNCERASQICMTADNSLGEVSKLLNDIRGLVTEGANSAGLSREMIEALQLQVDSSLEAIDRLAVTTEFMDKKLLDGSLDFTTFGVDDTKIEELKINQANFQGQQEKDVTVKVLEEAQHATLNYRFGAIPEPMTLQIGGSKGLQAFSFDKGASVEYIADAVNLLSDSLGVRAEVATEATQGKLTASSFGEDNDVIITASKPGSTEGNYVIKYTRPEEGNSALDLNYTAPSGNTPGEVEILLETSEWEQAVYHYNGNEDGTADNEFTLTARQAGAAMNDIQFNINNTLANPGDPPVVSYDWSSDPKEITFEVYYDNSVPPPVGTPVSELKTAFEAVPFLNSRFSFDYVPPVTGTGPVVPTTPVTQQTMGADGGEVVTTAEEIVELINTSPDLKDGDGNGILTASLPEGTQGRGTVTEFSEYALYGNEGENNSLQFLAPEDTPPIRLVSTPGTVMGIDNTTHPPIESKAKAIVQGIDAGTTFTLEALESGKDWNDVAIKMVQGSDDAALWDPHNKELRLQIDFAARTLPPADPNYKPPLTIADLENLVNNDPVVGSLFEAHALRPYDPMNPPEFDATTYDTGSLDNTLAVTSGGLVSEGMILINLETDPDGLIRTTANDLIDFFDHPPTTEAATILQELKVSVSSTGESDGSGLLKPTYDPEKIEDCEDDTTIDTTNMLPDITFASSGVETVEGNPKATIYSSDGVNAMFDIQANRVGEEYDGVKVAVQRDLNGPSAHYDDDSKQLSIGIDPSNPPTAQEVIDLINNDAELSVLFTAGLTTEIPDVDTTGFDPMDWESDGSGPIAIGNAGTLTGGLAEEGTPAGAPLLGNEDAANAGLNFYSLEPGSEEFVEVKSIVGGDFPVTDPHGITTERTYGKDIRALINDVQAQGNGRIASVSTSELDMKIWIDDSVRQNEVFGFRIDGGGVQLQLGPDAEPQQQVRFAFKNVYTSKLGGIHGVLSQLRSGGDSDLYTDTKNAYAIVEDAIKEIAFLRGRIGSFQKSLIESNMNQMSDVLETTVSANSQIRDTDFANATSRMTRDQILMEAGVSVLGYSNNNPRMLLELLND